MGARVGSGRAVRRRGHRQLRRRAAPLSAPPRPGCRGGEPAGSLDPASARQERPDRRRGWGPRGAGPVSYTHLRAHETVLDLVCRLLLEKKKNTEIKTNNRQQQQKK